MPCCWQDAVEEHDRWMRPREPAGEHSAVVGKQLVRHPSRASAALNAVHTERASARCITPAHTQNREWSSTPVSNDTTVASAKPEAHHVHLPELHRTRPLPAPVRSPLATPGEGLDELVCGPARDRCWCAPESRPRPGGAARGPGATAPSADGDGAGHTPCAPSPPRSGAHTAAVAGSGRPVPPSPTRGTGAARCARSAG